MDQASIHNRFSKRTFIFLIIALLTLLMGSLVALANENRVTVLASTLNVRYGPGLSHEILTQVHQDEHLHVLGEDNQWYKVRLSNNDIGWVASWLVENEEVTVDNRATGRITGNEVNVRQFSTTESPILGTVHSGEEYEILYSENNWIQILFNNRVAWIHSDYVERLEGTPATLASSDNEVKQIRIGMGPTNLRQGPGTDTPIVMTVNDVSEYTVIEETDDWYGIRLTDGKLAYVASCLAEAVDTEDSSTVQAAEAAPQAQYASSLAEATIVIDAGHGGHDPGAVAKTGFTESEVALSTSLRLAEILERSGANVILTRSDDSFVTLNDRVYYAHRARADAFISIHYDALEIPNTMSGTTTYYYSESERDLADTINTKLSQQGPLKNNGVRHGNYSVLRNNAQPSILLELGYLDNDHDITIVNTPGYQQTVAEAIHQGLGEYFAP
ncbi:N-acetylmuramoyl-L-alanine amidase [Alkalibacterium pelagium]|uniref:N-acetylmuramoyl-L-alanine amidase n=1 Tax=Alkalibacterium pelagium TaxID=426702 RepID=A0A1H7G551_9LACT|nr:N-acetylmuramoyl-L-alanine amidase [Alkalibacterium pelagium]GEN49924.1 N-acetylmuramoyl-L-alanine amidase [Alkalibacterium pelagium]SEK32597.1 N-acetylmuramoyl-L-alanine amidase [Alkalibacterium pelagium]